MPTYDYACAACGHTFETFQSITAKPLRKCPECGKSKLERLIGTGGGIIFKGSGFYITDYRSESYKKAAEAEKGGGEKPAGEKPVEKPTADKPAAASNASEAKPAAAASKADKPASPPAASKSRRKAS